MEFYHIDNDKNVVRTRTSLDASLVFAIPIPILQSDKGWARTSLSVAHHIADNLGVRPVFINGDEEGGVEKFLCEAPQSLLVGINLPAAQLDPVAGRDRFLSIGVNDFCTYEPARLCDIILNPCFNPVRNWAAESASSQQLMINCTCTPTHVRQNEVEKEDGQKIVAVYIRQLPSERDPTPNLRTMFKRLNKEGHTLLVTTGHATSGYDARKIKGMLSGLSRVEFYDYNEAKQRDTIFARSMRTAARYVFPDGRLPYGGRGKNRWNCNPYVSFLNRADAIIVSGDTVSGLSDAVAMQKPVFLYMTDREWEERFDLGNNGYDNKEWLLQGRLLQENRIQLLSTRNILESYANWKPPLYREWDDIGKTISNVINERLVKPETPRNLSVSGQKRAGLLTSLNAGAVPA